MLGDRDRLLRRAHKHAYLVKIENYKFSKRHFLKNQE